ncbi:YjdF family protein [uncultured Oscillibacter sp.]|uniref:YjdF family protein n=2 Tax=uncultured Oscillibacter sp. TaxID=876091 RepID=UPI0025DEC877|nr:YjdF family protein [uncultured Oscillibacter sp.]
METGYARLTVRFEDPFWVCLYERDGGGLYEVCRIVFGGEPGDQEVYAFLLEHWRELEFSPPIASAGPPAAPRGPKRARREAGRETRPAAMGTKAQQALALQREQGRAARARRTREEREAEQARRYALRQEKRKEKHKGH